MNTNRKRAKVWLRVMAHAMSFFTKSAQSILLDTLDMENEVRLPFIHSATNWLGHSAKTVSDMKEAEAVSDEDFSTKFMLLLMFIRNEVKESAKLLYDSEPLGVTQGLPVFLTIQDIDLIERGEPLDTVEPVTFDEFCDKAVQYAIDNLL
jgi:hypothetical protein